MTHLDLLRMRVAAAEATWREAKEQADQAKRRRKLARLLAKRAKKDAKSAKAHLDEVRQALAQAEARAAALRLRAAARKSRKGPGARSAKPKPSTAPRRAKKPAQQSRKLSQTLPIESVLAIVEAERMAPETPEAEPSAAS